MLSLIRRPTGLGGRRRGVTLVEMLVVVALVVLMMVILVQIFQSATGAMSASRTTQELDVNLRQVDSIIRSDLAGVTARMTPGMNDPKDKRGYFEYGENAFADAQGEDTDDWMAFTTRAPEGQVFSGRQWLALPANNNVQPITINSQVAEVIYFLRNGNLYRRVFLVAPERANSLYVPVSIANVGDFFTSIFGGLTYVSWQGMNDISCRPGGYSLGGVLNPIPNDLGDLTNREKRAFRPRFLNDFTSPAGLGPDGIPDDVNTDDVNDYYPTIYTDGTANYGDSPNIFVHDRKTARVSPGSYNIYAFPFIYPGMYSVPDPTRVKNSLGWVHYLYPNKDTNNNLVNNHSPLDLGDNLLPPLGNQVWWGFPTWRETMAGAIQGQRPGWTDPVNFLTRNGSTQPLGLQPFNPTMTPLDTSLNFLPPVHIAGTSNPPPFADTNAGSTSFIAIPAAPNRVWEDDLLLTGVRSFDIKAYDPYAPLYNTNQNGYFSAGYQDLGYGSTYYNATGLTTDGTNSFNYLGGPNGLNPNLNAQVNVPWQSVGGEPQGFGHEARIPPRTSDFRMHPRRGYNIGDDAASSNAGIIRLTRTFDTWSTDYINAPDQDIDLNLASSNSPALYPSFPPPYPSPLRGIQIQIRLVEPRGQKAKPITIRVDFTDKL